jgi:hypothetical protein
MSVKGPREESRYLAELGGRHLREAVGVTAALTFALETNAVAPDVTQQFRFLLLPMMTVEIGRMSLDFILFQLSYRASKTDVLF